MKTTQNFLRHNSEHARYRQLTGLETAFNRFEFTTLLSLRYLATTCLVYERIKA